MVGRCVLRVACYYTVLRGACFVLLVIVFGHVYAVLRILLIACYVFYLLPACMAPDVPFSGKGWRFTC